MVAGAPAALGIGDVVVGHYDSVDGDVVGLGVFPKVFDGLIEFLLCQRSAGCFVHTGDETIGLQIVQLVGFALHLLKSLQNIEGHEGDTALFTVGGVHQPDRTGCQIASIFIGLSSAVQQSRFQHFKITGTDKRLACDHQPALIRDPQGDAGDTAGVVGNDFTLVTIATGSRFHQSTALIGQLDRQAVQLQHKHDKLVAHEGKQLLTALCLVQGQKRNDVDSLLQLADRRPAHCLGRGVRHPHPSGLFQLSQLVKEPVIHFIAYGGSVQIVILVPVLIEPVVQVPKLLCLFQFHCVASSEI